jgi:signal transduction histidine kinase
LRRGAKPAKSKVEAKLKPPIARKSRKSEGFTVRDLEKRLAEALKREAEAFEQQTATAEILRVMSSSLAQLQPVLDAIAERAARLCDASNGTIILSDGEALRMEAHYGPLAEQIGIKLPIDRRSVSGRAFIEGRPLHVDDLSEAAADFPLGRQIAAHFGIRTFLAVPLIREAMPIGLITMQRTEIRPFSDKQIELLKTFADHAVIAIENVRLFKELEVRNRDLTEALEQQTATAEVLRIISTSPTELQPVLEVVVKSAGRFCGADDAIILRLDGENLWAAAHHGPIPVDFGLPIPCVRGTVGGRSVLDRRAVHVTDLQAATAEFPEGSTFAKQLGAHTTLGVPLLREGAAVGTIQLRRAEADPFTDKQIDLLQTFADQAVIAIENTRLFTELQEKNRALTEAHGQVSEALEQQTATSEILRVISGTPTDVQPVFDAMVSSAARLCDAVFCVAYRFDGALIYPVAHHNMTPDALEALKKMWPAPPSRDTVTARSVLERSIVHVTDVVQEGVSTASIAFGGTLGGYRTMLAVPMFRDGIPIGTISVARREERPFTDSQIELLKTFADQAVIAIENVRLFKELEARNTALTEALNQQTATAEILRVISSSPTEVEPVFAAIVHSAVRLCGGTISTLYRYDGHRVHFGVTSHPSGIPQAITRGQFPRPADMSSLIGRAIVERAVMNVADMETDPRAHPGIGRVAARQRGFRSMVIVPMYRENQVVGVITVGRAQPGEFSDADVALLQTFADQAVIAIENVRLFTELQARTMELTRSVGELRALGEVGQAISSTLDLRTVLSTIVARATHLSATDAGVIYEYDEQREIFLPRATVHLEADILETMLATPVRKGEGTTGRLAEIHEPNQVPDILVSPAESRVRGALVRAGYRALLAVPLVREDHLLGGLTVVRKMPGEFPDEVIELLQTFGTQSALAIQNARLFREIEDKSRQLEVASQHKSEFLANMSHELRTPLNAIIGFSEVLGERLFGELNEKQEEYLKDIHASGQHLLSLINDILDLSKIEAGRMELELTDFHLPTALDTAVSLVRERAGRRGIALHMAPDERLHYVRADERKIKQVLLNLLSNAIKFTPEGGRIEVRAQPVDGSVEVSVTDTGVGIAPEDQEAIFEEFRQVGTAAKKVEGTGLGLALSRKFIELHGGRIWVESQVGVGSTFTFTIPVPRGE